MKMINLEGKMSSRLFIVIPCYNEEEVLPITSKMFLEEMQLLIEKGKISNDSRILFVNDGSKDNTKSEIIRAQKEDKRVRLVTSDKTGERVMQ